MHRYGAFSGNLAFVAMNVSWAPIDLVYLVKAFQSPTRDNKRITIVAGVFAVLAVLALIIWFPYKSPMRPKDKEEYYGKLSAIGASIMYYSPIFKMVRKSLLTCD